MIWPLLSPPDGPSYSVLKSANGRVSSVTPSARAMGKDVDGIDFGEKGREGEGVTYIHKYHQCLAVPHACIHLVPHCHRQHTPTHTFGPGEAKLACWSVSRLPLKLGLAPARAARAHVSALAVLCMACMGVGGAALLL